MLTIRFSLCALSVLACGCNAEQVEIPTGTPMPGATRVSAEASETEFLVVTNDNFQAEVLESEQPVLLDCWAPWCSPCKMLEPTIAQLAAQYKGRIKVAKLNIDDAPEIAGTLNVTGIPAVFLFNKGEVTETLVGVQPKANYAAAIEGLK